MIYLLKNNRRKSGPLGRKSITGIGLGVILVLAYIFLGRPLHQMTYFMARPFWSAGNVVLVWSHNIDGFFSSKTSLEAENQNLKEELSRARVNDLVRQALQTENADLRNKLLLQPEISSILATVLAVPPQVSYDTLVVDNSQHNIFVGAPVFFEKGVSLGTIASVGGKTATAMLFSQAGLETGANLERTGERYSLTGFGGGNLFLQVPRDTDVKEGDIFTLPTDGSVIGTVGHIISEDTATFKKIFINLPINIQSLHYVFVGTKTP